MQHVFSLILMNLILYSLEERNLVSYVNVIPFQGESDHNSLVCRR